jgi:gas vesicle protein
MTDIKDLQTRIRDLSGDLQKTLEDAVDQWTKEGKGQLRESIGATDTGTVWMAFLSGIVLGAIVGGVVALLMAPKSGSELRDELAERARQTNGMTREPAGGPVGTSAI